MRTGAGYMTDSFATNIAKINGMIKVMNVLIMRSLIRCAIRFIFFSIFSIGGRFAGISSMSSPVPTEAFNSAFSSAY